MASPLLVSSESFRKKLIVRNLVPYPKSPSKVSAPIDYDAPISNYSVVDSPDTLIDEPLFSKDLYKVNQYGAEGGYKQVPDPGALLNTKSNEGEYGYQDANIVEEGKQEARKYRPLNAYADGVNIFDGAEAVSSLETVIRDGNRLPNGQPYYPLQFVPSYYRNVSILLSRDPVGSDGLLSQDSYIARLGADLLRKGFEERIAAEIRINTIGRINAFNVRGGTDILSLATGRVPLIEPNYRITSPANPILAATDFALRLAGSIIPVSTIPGSYFDPSINSGQPVTIQQLNNAFRKSAVGKFVNSLLGTNRSGSQLFLDNTGGGQKSRLFGNLDYNRYKPGYSRGVFDRLLGAIVGTNENNSNFYIGSTTSEPSRVFSPSGDLPNNSFGQEQQSAVYGPSELAQLYEGPSREVRLGANGLAYTNGGGIEGGLTWISPGTESNAGKKVGIGGQTSSSEPVQSPSSFGTTTSTKIQFKNNSILDNTQRLIDSAPKSGGRRLQHVGNAIDQVSKVFNDGYKELTKGSRVLSYTYNTENKTVEGGVEYCRVFSKDLPYLQYNDLQKSQGMTTQNRRISSSVLDSTYNLNIYPNKKNSTADSTNLVGNPDTDGYAKKYMFSLENLAWRTSSKPGFTWADLPICERGPNKGRVMWFPPYGLTFTETTSASWKDSNFIGRPEPIYTYSNTSRTGSLSWKIVVDHPSVLNLIVNKVINDGESREKINSTIDSFFAGCLKYDLYELVKKYPLANPNDLYIIQKEIELGQLNVEQVVWTQKELASGNDSTTNADKNVAESPNLSLDAIKNDIAGLGFYFNNNSPQGSSISPYSIYYNQYINKKTEIINDAPTTTNPSSSSYQVSVFFNSVIEQNFSAINQQLNKIYELAVNGTISSVNFKLVGTTSPLGSQGANLTLSNNRIKSVKEYINNYIPNITSKSILSKIPNFTITFDEQAEGESNAQVKEGTKFGDTYSCGQKKDSDAPSNEVNTVNAMACRSVRIKSIDLKANLSANSTASEEPVFVQQFQQTQIPTSTFLDKTRFRNNITKRVLRLMMTECDYFESIKEDTPMVYDNLKDKLKFFNPAFHSTTPEGLNSRLTFLQQCMRPGETIPTVRSSNGTETLEYNNAVNTSFGAPPVLVLRVGDFFNTKIIPDSLQIQYENLDLNPEGVGIQPMIANVTLSFKFVGGSGIKEAIDRIQNALSFNYYANTEVYDDRADVTDFSLNQLDKDFQALYAITETPADNKTQNNNGQNNNSFIGEVLTSVNAESGTTGEVSYTTFISSFVDETQNYFNTVFNKNKEVFSQYNEGIRQLWTYGRGYTKGSIPPNGTDTEYFIGKPLQYQQNIKEIFTEYNYQIVNDIDKFLNFIMNNKNISVKAIRQIKQNYLNLITQRQNGFENSLSKIIQEVVIVQQKYYKDLQRLLIITYGNNSGTDGLQNKKGETFVYYTTGNSLNTLIEDKNKTEENLKNYYIETTKELNFTTSSGKESKNILVQPTNNKFSVTTPFTPVSQSNFPDELSVKFQYMILNQDIVDDKKYQSFKDSLIADVLSNPSLMENSNPELSKIVDDYWIGYCKPIFVNENKDAQSFLDSIQRGQLRDYLNYTAINKTTERKLNYSNLPDATEDTYKEARNDYIVSLGASTNNNTNTETFNDAASGPSGSIYISKSKLN